MRVWKYALGSFSDEKTEPYDNYVVMVRSIIFVSYLVTNCFITAGVIRHWNDNTMSKMDTQGMSGPVDPNYKGSNKPQEHKPWVVKPNRLFTETYAKELKILINEVLDEREGKLNYTSYFDVEKFKYYVGEEEPPYKPDLHK